MTEHVATQSANDAIPEDVVMIPVEAVREYAGNPRKNDHAVEKMADIIAAHGFRVPILVKTAEDGEGYDLVDGHLRIKAAKALGMDEVPAILVDDMPEEQVQAFRISVNRAAELADWDMTKLRSELESIKANFDDSVNLSGFDDDVFAKLAKDTPAPAAKTRNSEPINRSADKKAATRDTDNVTLSLNMTAAEREAGLAGLEKLRKARSIETNAAVILQLIGDAVAVLDAETAPKQAPRQRKKT